MLHFWREGDKNLAHYRGRGEGTAYSEPWLHSNTSGSESDGLLFFFYFYFFITFTEPEKSFLSAWSEVQSKRTTQSFKLETQISQKITSLTCELQNNLEKQGGIKTTNKDLLFNISGTGSCRQDKEGHIWLHINNGLCGKHGVEVELTRNWKHSCPVVAQWAIKDPRWPLPETRRNEPMQQRLTQQKLVKAQRRVFPQFHNLSMHGSAMSQHESQMLMLGLIADSFPFSHCYTHNPQCTSHFILNSNPIGI